LDSIDAALVGIAADEVSGKRASRWQRPAPRLALLVVACALVTVSLLFVWRWPGTPTSVVDAQPLVARTEVSAQAPEPDSFDDAVSAMAIVAGWWQGAARTGGGCGDARPGEALCARLRVNESMMRALDRPLVLELRAGERQRWLALRRLQSEVAQIAGMNSLANADWRAQAEQWLGDVVLVVASPVGYDGAVIAEGAAGPLVTRIHEALSAFDGTTVEGVDHLFSATTTQRVRALQAHHGLRADGLVGPETLALLVALGKDGPRLSDPLDPKSFVSAEQP
jgi:general secretion pathway protein A